jgi:FMN phosphatase YigB (HAD superfamily)
MALRTAGIEPSRGLFVGDSLRHDVQGPAAVGMQTAWMAPSATADPGDIRPDAVIHELADVLGIVGVGVGR